MQTITKLHPTVCAVGRSYQIMIVTECDALVSIRVGDKMYCSHSNGIKKSLAGVHRVCVPSCELDMKKGYTLILQKIIERSPYFPTSEEKIEIEYEFRPIVKKTGINIYHLADVHGEREKALGAAKYMGGEYDLLIFNGDIANSTDSLDDIILCYKIASEITKGEIPCIISRGNHDMRGANAERLADYMPGDNGKSYYTFRIGCIWGILVDAGEDKEDFSDEYGGTICCHSFRLEQEEMLKEVVKRADEEYLADGILYRIVISHMPFTFENKPPFNIEKPLYKRWAKLIQNEIKPDFMLCGHTHRASINYYTDENDADARALPIIVGSDVRLDAENEHVVSIAEANLVLRENEIEVTVNTENEILFRQTLKIKDNK